MVSNITMMINNLEMAFDMMMLKRSKRCHKMRIWVMLLNCLQFNSGGLIGRDNHLHDGEEPECYQESMESEERQKAWQSKLQKCVALSTTKAEVGFVQDEHWLFCDSQSTIHLVPRGKFEACCEIAGLAITYT
ncbi:hypothetical protein CR513_34367, partial [Mucuna pruriens]